MPIRNWGFIQGLNIFDTCSISHKKLFVFSFFMKQKAIWKIVPIGETSITFIKGISYRFVLYVASIIRTNGNKHTNSTVLGCAKTTSLKTLVSGSFRCQWKYPLTLIELKKYYIGDKFPIFDFRIFWITFWTYLPVLIFLESSTLSCLRISSCFKLPCLVCSTFETSVLVSFAADVC